MPVTLGAKPQHGFDQPLGLLSDCHRRIERFLDVMLRVVDRAAGRALSVEERKAIETALRYFNSAAPRHTQDEEDSLFPRLRESSDPAVQAALARVDALEADHRVAEAGHAEAERWCRRWLDDGPLAPPQLEKLRSVLSSLRDGYARHIAVEDQELFPLAGRVLDGPALQEIGQEMARRRQVQAVRSENFLG